MSVNVYENGQLRKIAGNASGGGGGSGADNYNSLSNLPQIEGVTLKGNKTFADLGMVQETVDLDFSNLFV